MEIIDGQQRLTTLMLLLRAFYDKFKNMKDDKSEKAIGDRQRARKHRPRWLYHFSYKYFTYSTASAV